MRLTFARAAFLALIIASAHSAQAAGGEAATANTNAPALPVPVARRPGLQLAEESMRQLHVTMDRITALEAKTKAAANQRSRLECVREKLQRMNSLFELASAAYAKMVEAAEQEDARRAEEFASQIVVASTRATQLAKEADACSNSVASKYVKRPGYDAEEPALPVKEPPPPIVVRREPRPQPAPRASIPRTERECLPQGQWALMLGQAMDLNLDNNNSSAACLAALSKLSVQPLRGWEPDHCTTVDDLCVSAARAMNLKIENPDDPASYAEALRREGIAIDELLPARPAQGAPPPLLESEARAFLVTGYAAPLSTRRGASRE